MSLKYYFLILFELKFYAYLSCLFALLPKIHSIKPKNKSRMELPQNIYDHHP